MTTVLIVDDDPVFLSALEALLVSAEYTVLTAITGGEAVDLLEKKHSEIALAIIDLALPDINGFEIIGALSRRPNPIKILATTGAFKDTHLEMAGSLGAHAAIRKPAPGRALVEREWLETVAQLVGKPNSERRANAASAHGTPDKEEGTNGSDTDH